MPPLTPGPHTHEQWLGLLRPVGLVVAPAVLSALQLFPNQSTPYLSARQRQLEGLLEDVEGPNGQPLAVVPSFQLLATDLLDWGEADLVPAAELQAVPEVVLQECGETLRPTHGVPAFEQPTAESSAGAESATKLQALVLDLTPPWLPGLAWPWLVPAGSHSHTSRSLERWPNCTITPSGQLTLLKGQWNHDLRRKTAQITMMIDDLL